MRKREASLEATYAKHILLRIGKAELLQNKSKKAAVLKNASTIYRMIFNFYRLYLHFLSATAPFPPTSCMPPALQSELASASGQLFYLIHWHFPPVQTWFRLHEQKPPRKLPK